MVTEPIWGFTRTNLPGRTYLYHGSFVVKGNFASNANGAALFNVQGGNLPYLVGTLTTTAASQDVLSGSWVSPGSQCFVQPANAQAAQMVVGTYVSGTNWGAVTVSHPGVAGGSFQVWCQ